MLFPTPGAQWSYHAHLLLLDKEWRSGRTQIQKVEPSLRYKPTKIPCLNLDIFGPALIFNLKIKRLKYRNSKYSYNYTSLLWMLLELMLKIETSGRSQPIVVLLNYQFYIKFIKFLFLLFLNHHTLCQKLTPTCPTSPYSFHVLMLGEN